MGADRRRPDRDRGVAGARRTRDHRRVPAGVRRVAALVAGASALPVGIDLCRHDRVRVRLSAVVRDRAAAPATTATLGVLSAPAVGVVASMLVLGERPSIHDIIGFVLILAAAAYVLLAPTTRSPEAAPIEQ